MAAITNWYEQNGSATGSPAHGTEHAITSIEWKSVDDTTTSRTVAPVTAGSNSYGKYDVGGDSKIPTGWVSLTKFNKKFRGVGLIVKPNYKISKTVKTKINCFYKSMGIKYKLQNTNERIPDVPI
jgi:hypothetical protein